MRVGNYSQLCLFTVLAAYLRQDHRAREPALDLSSHATRGVHAGFVVPGPALRLRCCANRQVGEWTMHRTLLFLFTAYALASVYIQTADLPIKQITTPVMGAFVAVCALIGLFARRLRGREALILASGWALGGCGEIFFERVRLAATAAEAGQNFMIAGGLFLLAFLTF